MKISVIVPVYNEANNILACLNSLQDLRAHGHQIIVVDGGSQDGSKELAAPLSDLVVDSPKGRALQMNTGAGIADGDVLIFLHADSLINFDLEFILNSYIHEKSAWGRFDVCLSGGHILYRVIEYFMNYRSRITSIATGDQTIFVTRSLFNKIGGFPEIELMEDIEISKILKSVLPPICIKERITISSRRWEEKGILRTIIKMWSLRLRYRLGANPVNLARDYE